MKKILYLTILIAAALSVVSFAEVTSKITRQYTIINPEIITYYEGDKVVAVKTLTESGEVKTLTGHIPNGQVRRYYPNGKLFVESYYKNDKLDGSSKAYFSTGTLEASVSYKNGKLNGPAKEYYETGKVRRSDNFVNGQMEGLTKIYNDNGTVRSEINYLHGAPDGICRFYDRNGKLVREEHYINGKLTK
jgi:antitoxin component YwqK of YwqJK toxin-antitoxin module